MATMAAENVARAPYTLSSSSAERPLEVVTMMDVASVVFVVDDDVSVRESLELLIRPQGGSPKPLPHRRTSCLALASMFPAAWCST